VTRWLKDAYDRAALGSPPVASPPASVEEIARRVASTMDRVSEAIGGWKGPFADDLRALLSDRAAMAERVAGLERDLEEARNTGRWHEHNWRQERDIKVEAIGRSRASEAEVARLREALERMIFALETTNVCLMSWNGGRGSPAPVDDVLAAARAALTRPMGEPKLPDGWLKEGIDAALTRPDEPTKET